MENQLQTGVCAYIDLLGFSNHVKNDPEAALLLLQNYQAILTMASTDLPTHESLIPYHQDSFKYFIPFSDSVFIYSENLKTFAEQLSNFLHSCFSFTSKQYCEPEDANHPHRVTVTAVEIEDGKPVTKKYIENWHPLFFRGGIGFGTVKVIELNAVYDSKKSRAPVVFGHSVVEAVKLEQAGVKGPRLLCGQNFYDQLDNRTKRIAHASDQVKGAYEINWTAIHYLASEEPIFFPEDPNASQWFVDQLLQNDFYSSMLVPAANLWKAYNHLDVAAHYFNFLRMVVVGVIRFFEESPFQDYVKEQVIDYLTKVGIDNKADDLMR